MSLLRDIQSAAISSSVPLPTLLRQCKILAARLGNAEFKNWVDDELEGYSGKETLPSYRILHVHSKGHFLGPFQSQFRNADIPLLCIPEEYREGLEVSKVRISVAAIESLVSKSEGGSASEPWDPSLVAIVGQGIYQGMNCVQAWNVIPMNSLVAVLDSVRTRVLNFVLDIEAEDPDAGEAPINSNPVPPERVQQIFNTNIYGNVQNMASGSEGVIQNTHIAGIDPKVFQEMLLTISSTKADSELIREMSGIVTEMRDAKRPEDLKTSYIKFTSILADQITIWGPILAPFLPILARNS